MIYILYFSLFWWRDNGHPKHFCLADEIKVVTPEPVRHLSELLEQIWVAESCTERIKCLHMGEKTVREREKNNRTSEQ